MIQTLQCKQINVILTPLTKPSPTMTVISKPRGPYFPVPYQNYSSTESLHITGTANADPLFNSEASGNKATESGNAQIRLAGKRKIRRYKNQRFLLDNLDEELEDTVSLLEPYRAYFIRLTQDEFWHDFKGEKKQVASVTKEKLKLHNFRNLSAKIKRVLRKRSKMAAIVLREMEVEVVTFFQETYDAVYVRVPKNYLERLLLRGVTQFYGLICTSAIVQGHFVVEVENLSEKLTPHTCTTLLEHIVNNEVKNYCQYENK